MTRTTVIVAILACSTLFTQPEISSAQGILHRIRTNRTAAKNSQNRFFGRWIAARQDRTRNSFFSRARRKQRRADRITAYQANGGNSRIDTFDAIPSLLQDSSDSLDTSLSSSTDLGIDMNAINRKMEWKSFNRNYSRNPDHRAANGY